MPLDPAGIADHVVRNNMGVEAIELALRGRVAGTEFTVAETGQRFTVEGAPASASGPWFVWDVQGFGSGESPVLRWRSEGSTLTLEAAGIGVR